MNDLFRYSPVLPNVQYSPLNLNDVQQQTLTNNAIAGHLRSWENRATQELKAFDHQNLTTTTANLAQLPIFPLSDGIMVNAPLPFNRLPRKARQLIRAISAEFEVPQEMVTACLLATISIAAQGKFKVRVNDHHIEVLTLYLLVAAASGKRKSVTVDFFRNIIQTVEGELRHECAARGSGALRKLAAATIKKMEAKLADRFAELIAEHGDIEVAEELLAKEISDLEQLKASLSKRKALPRILVGISTLEKLAEIMAGQDEAIGLLDAEGGALKNIIKNPDMLDLVLKGFTGEPFSYDTKTAGSVSMTCPTLTICFIAQLTVLEAAYQNEELIARGMMPRFLSVILSNHVQTSLNPHDGIPQELTEWILETVRRLVRIRQPEAADGKRCPHVIDLSPGAKAEIDHYSLMIKQQIQNGVFDQYSAFGDKLVGQAVRLAGVIHLMTAEDPLSETIDAEAMRCGVALAEFFRQHAAIAFSPEARDSVIFAPKILKWIRRHRIRDFTETNALRGVGHAKIAQIRAGLDELDRHNFVRRVYTARGRTYCVHPNAYGFL